MFDDYDFGLRVDIRLLKNRYNRFIHRLRFRRFLRVCPASLRMTKFSNRPFIYYRRND